VGKEIKDSKDNKVIRVGRVLMDSRVHKDSKDDKDFKVSLADKEIRAYKGTLDHKVFRDCREKLVDRVHKD
jgi:hypothetical protein